MILTTSISCERVSSSRKCVNDYMRYSQREEQLSNKDLLKKMKEGRGANTFYNNIINEFAKKKQRTEMINKKILITHYL